MTSSVYKDMGRMALSTGGFRYKDTEVSDKIPAGDGSKGFYACMEGFNVARVVVAAACLGGARKCIEIAADYAKQREGLRSFIIQVPGDILLTWRTCIPSWTLLKLQLARGAWMIDNIIPSRAVSTQKQIIQLLPQCKWLAPQLAVEAAKRAIMICGAFRYTKDSPLEMAMRGRCLMCPERKARPTS